MNVGDSVCLKTDLKIPKLDHTNISLNPGDEGVLVAIKKDKCRVAFYINSSFSIGVWLDKDTFEVNIKHEPFLKKLLKWFMR